jgi:hypothetical protein
MAPSSPRPDERLLPAARQDERRRCEQRSPTDPRRWDCVFGRGGGSRARLGEEAVQRLDGRERQTPRIVGRSAQQRDVAREPRRSVADPGDELPGIRVERKQSRRLRGRLSAVVPRGSGGTGIGGMAAGGRAGVGGTPSGGGQVSGGFGGSPSDARAMTGGGASAAADESAGCACRMGSPRSQPTRAFIGAIAMLLWISCTRRRSTGSVSTCVHVERKPRGGARARGSPPLLRCGPHGAA